MLWHSDPHPPISTGKFICNDAIKKHDKPSRFGVPPYISPYVRYMAGAIKDAGMEYEYMTIEEWRKGKKSKIAELLVKYGTAGNTAAFGMETADKKL